MHRITPILRVVVALMTGLLIGGTMAAADDTTPARTIFLDPGHGGPNGGGAVRRNSQGEVVLREQEVALAVALKTAELLRSQGYQVILSRENDQRPGSDRDINGDGRINYRDGLQAAVDLANASGADLFISLHSNSAQAPEASGIEVYYCDDREFAAENQRLAELVQAHLLQALQGIGYPAVDRGIKDDSVLYSHRRRQGHLFVLGPARTGSRWRVHPRASQMPGVLAEALFVTNEADAQLLASDEGQLALARGYAAAVEAYFVAPANRTQIERITRILAGVP